ncbi:MAG: serine protein kinase RIO [Candidatus Methanospirare jalkutatii]|nr:serine protein kinase RIO [Candidatus Methanospirare jalkutatii]
MEGAEKKEGGNGALEEFERWEREPKGKKRKKDYKLMKVERYVFDDLTLQTLYKLAQRRIIAGIGGPISTGKESIVFHAIGGSAAGSGEVRGVSGEEVREEQQREIAVKIYKVSTSNFKAMLEYILGDPRFENVKKDRRSVVFTWARKEFKNLKRAFRAGVSVPAPIAYEKNVLVMDFIGREGIPAPRLRDVPEEILRTHAQHIFERILASVKVLYEKAGLVHADLSEFNILLDFKMEGGEEERVRVSEGIPASALSSARPVLIDMGQAVLTSHPKAMDFLQRDLRNIVAFFQKLGLNLSHEDVCKEILS